MNTFVLDYAKVSPIIVLDVLNRQFSGHIVARWIDFDSDTFGILVTAVDNNISDVEANWIKRYLAPFLFDYEKEIF